MGKGKKKTVPNADDNLFLKDSKDSSEKFCAYMIIFQYGGMQNQKYVLYMTL